MWCTVPYKRAVDKTSQGLRERDKEDGKPGEDSKDVPSSFSGKQKNPNLEDLAEVAIAHANRTGNLAGVGKRGMNQPLSLPPKKRKADIDDNPLPPSMQPRQSSMFRFLKGSQLLPSSWGEPAPAPPPASNQQLNVFPTKLNNLNNVHMGRKSTGSLLDDDTPATQDAARAPSALYAGPSTMMSAGQSGFGYPPQLGMGMSSFSTVPLNSGTSTQTVELPQDGQQALGAPALTRLTTQVSDWLKNSFWPVGPSTSSHQPAQEADTHIPKVMPRNVAVNTATAIASLVPPPVARPPAPAKKQFPGIPQITTVPPPTPAGPVKINTIPPPSRSVDLNAKNNGYGSSHNNGFGSYSEMQLNDGPDDRQIAPPTEVERKASASLLALSGAPSGLFRGLSSLLGMGNETAPEPIQPPAPLEPVPAPVGFKKSKRSLLDDDDETAEETRLRAVPFM